MRNFVFYDWFCQTKLISLQMREKMLEMKELKQELAFAHAANKARKFDNMASQVEERRGRSLDGWDSDANVQQLRAQVRLNLKIVLANFMHFR